MEPSKFEENIKEKLEDRKLQPSQDAWSKLYGRLEAKGTKQNKKIIWWVGIAASVIGVLFLAFQFFNKTEGFVPVIVDSPTIIQQKDNNQVVIEKPNGVLEKARPVEKIKELQLKENSTIHLKESSIACTEEKVIPHKKNKTETFSKILNEDLTFEEQKIQDVVAKVQFLKAQNEVVSDDVIEALLLEAQKEVRLQQFYNDAMGVVDASALLQEVEADLDQSFRSKVFDAIKASYGTVKTAVVQRND